MQQIKERGAYLIDRGDIRQAIDRCSNITGFTAGAGYGRSEHKADSLIAKFQSELGWSERLMYEQIAAIICSVIAYIRLPVMNI